MADTLYARWTTLPTVKPTVVKSRVSGWIADSVHDACVFPTWREAYDWLVKQIA